MHRSNPNLKVIKLRIPTASRRKGAAVNVCMNWLDGFLECVKIRDGIRRSDQQPNEGNEVFRKRDEGDREAPG
jgi:hypothetical protein